MIVYNPQADPALDLNQMVIEGAQPKLKRRQLLYQSEGALHKSEFLSNIQLRNFTLLGGKEGIRVEKARDIAIEDVSIKNTDYGLVVKDAYGVDVTSSKIDNTKYRGILARTSTRLKFIRNTITDSNYTGIDIDGGNHLIDIVENTIDGTGLNGGGDGITLTDSTHLKVSVNKILRAGCYGIWVTRNV